MKRKAMAMAAAVAAGALALSGCGGSSDGGSAGATKSTITIGIKYDQPGLGLQTGGTFKGFDVDVATYIAGKLGYPADKITFTETPSPQRETMLQNGQVDMIVATYSITDARKQKVSFAGPYFVAGQSLLVQESNTDITGPETMNGKKLCSVAGSTPAQNIKDKYSAGVQLQEYDTYSKCVEALASGAVDAVTTDDIILAGYAAQDQYKGKLKLVGKPFSTERYGVGLPKGSANCTKVNDAIKAMIDDGSWQKFLDANMGGTGYTPNAEENPPKTFETCS